MKVNRHISPTSDSAAVDASTRPAAKNSGTSEGVSSESFDARPDLVNSPAKVRGISTSQKMAIEIMLRQLGLPGSKVSDLLGIRYSCGRIDDLTYREAASLIAHLGQLLRKRVREK